MFVVAVAADDERTVQRNAVPEKIGDVGKMLIAGQLINARGAYDFRDLHVGMQAIEPVFTPRQRIHDGLVIKLPGEDEIICVAGDGIKIGERLVHATLFADQHFLPLGFRQVLRGGVRPIGEVRGHLQRLGIAAPLLRVNQPRKFLVQVVPGNPAAVESKIL